LSDEDLDALAQRVSIRVFGDGETVVRQGEGGNSLFIVLCGDLDVYVDGNKVGGLKGGDFFGEMSLLTGENRRATVAATDEVWLMEISKSAVEPILRAHPSVLDSLSKALERRAEANWAAQQSRKISAEAPTRSDVFLKKIKSFFGIS
jgi:CRP-like cAMP-binding protein